MSVLVASLLAVTAAVAVSVVPARASFEVVVIDGRGWGHGVGMAQDGAFWMGTDGASTGQILGQFYPGTQLGSASGPVRVVVVARDDGRAEVTFPGGGEVRSPLMGAQHAGFPLRMAPGETAVLSFDGTYRAERAGVVQPASTGGAREERVAAFPAQSPTTTSPLPSLPTSSTSSTSTTTTTSPLSGVTTTTAAPDESDPSADDEAPPDGEPNPSTGPSSPEPLWAVPTEGEVGVPDRGAHYRGVIEATNAGGGLRLVNHVDVEDYLRGMGEVRDPSWPASGLEAQAIAARTYALRAMAVSGQICDTQRCQVYLGQEAEYAAMDRAVVATRGVVLMDADRLALSFYSANAGGHTGTPQEGFGTSVSNVSYLRAAPYLTRDPRPWQVTVGTADVAARLGYPGSLRSVRVAEAGPSGRALEIELDGDAGVRTVTGRRFTSSLGLLSNLFTVRVEQADEAPPPPPAPDGELFQASPDDVADVALDPPERVRVQRRAPTTGITLETAGRDLGTDRDVPGWAIAILLALILAAGGAGLRTLTRTERDHPPSDPTA
ncbi:MAG TPA: SpoIID/LytB domain-containing protein [Acidimicrobiales bacterium]|nr:SpoIID/LytB domain-containing protein [Acidimicrobiales bacterium]